jgi:transcriptional regulator with XRE-family HTH domain
MLYRNILILIENPITRRARHERNLGMKESNRARASFIAESRPGKPATVLIDSFAYNLRRARIAAGLSQSDLARKIWGTTKTKSGYIVAHKRDRISAYESGAQAPTSETLMEIAKALNMSPLALAPEMGKNAEFKESEAITLTVLKGQPDRVHLKVNVLTSLDLASRILAMLNASEKDLK